MCKSTPSPLSSDRQSRTRRFWILPLVGLVRIYQWGVSPLIHALSGGQAGCRFQPTCSQYTIEALETHGMIRGLQLATSRLLRCGPWSKGGYDPVPGVRDPGSPDWSRETQPHS